MYIVTTKKQKRQHVASLITKKEVYFVYPITEDDFKNYDDDDIFILVDKVIDYLVDLNNVLK